MKTTEKLTTIEKLIRFVNQRPGMNFADYGDVKAYRNESARITKDRNAFFDLLTIAQNRIGSWTKGQFVSTLNQSLTAYLQRSNGRLAMNKAGDLQYCTGQYFPTEYRPAACRVLADLIWADYRDEKKANEPNPVYKDGHEIRKAIKRNLRSHRAKEFFN